MAACGHPWTRALVTGASSGIGRAIVEVLAAAGVPTVAVARRADRLEALAARHPDVEPLAADLHDPVDRRRVTDRVGDDGAGAVDLLVNNAGFGATGPFASVGIAAHLEQLDLNCAALVALSHAFVQPRPTPARRWLLNVSSVAGFVAAPGAATYAATKAFVTSFSEALAQEGRADGIVVTALCPGLTRSEFHQRATGYSGRPGLASHAPRWAWMSAEAVAVAGLRGGERGAPVVVPGALNRLLVAGAAVVPRPLRASAAARVRRR
ncbi:MAG: SDR family NAD(P)-dependent oxidoreductase [Acidimicrobiia bacterium]